jgi:alcohol dehydrogenase class IV
MKYEFSTVQRIIFGSGSIRQLPDIVKEFGTRALVICGRTPSRWAAVFRLLSEAGLELVEYHLRHEPTVRDIDDCSKVLKENPVDVVIGLGGGSCIDAAKAVSVMFYADGSVFDYLEVVGKGKKVTKKIPCIAVPTTAGTGAEVTKNSVILVPESRIKASLRNILLLPEVALVDPELCLGLPFEITASTGLDAFTQLIEAFVSLKSNAFTDMICKEGLTYASRYLVKSCEQPLDMTARTGMSHAALLSGLALANAGLGAIHGLAAPLGGLLHAGHGAICAALLPGVTKANIEQLHTKPDGYMYLEKYREICRIVTGDDGTDLGILIKWLSSLVERLQIHGLKMFGLEEEKIPEIVMRALNSSSIKGNPVPLSQEQLEKIVLDAM